MRRFITVTILLFIVITVSVSFPGKKVFACSCVSGDAKEKLERSTAVFVGKVIDKGRTKKSNNGPIRKYTFAVDKTWKGVKDRHITIYSYDGDSASCGFEFDRGQTYLVFSYQDKDNSLQTNLCSGNIPIAQAGEELKQLGTGKIIRTNEMVDDESHQDRISINILLSSGIILIIVISTLFILRKMKR